MQNDERVRLLELARGMSDAHHIAQVNDVLAADPATYPVVVTFRVRDPYLELGDTPESYELTRSITMSVIEELAPEWWDKAHGAGWYVDAAKGLDGSGDAHGWVKIEVPEAYRSTQLDDRQLRDQLLEVIENFDTRTWGQPFEALAKIESLIRA